MKRRDFITGAALSGMRLPLVSSVAFGSCKDNAAFKVTPEKAGMFSFVDKAPDGKPLRAALIGCGGRGTGAAGQFLKAGNGLSVTALADVFPDRMDSCRKVLKEEFRNEVPDANCFIGFDAYKRVLSMPEIDLVLLCTPQHFRPEHFAAAVEAGKHVFMEKPCAVDPVGVRTVIIAARAAQSKGLTVVAGTHLRHRRDCWEAYMHVRNGLIGDVICASAHADQGAMWHQLHRPEWSDMEYCIRNFFNIKWLSGDHLVDQAIHYIDIALWFMDERPERAVGYGGRARRLTGDIYDFFAIDYYCGSGKRMWTEARQIDGCDADFSDQIYGTKGIIRLNDANSDVKIKITDYSEETLWEYNYAEKPVKNPYEQEHIHLVESIRENKKINQAEPLAYSTLVAILGRESAYSGKPLTWQEIMASGLRYGPATYEMGTIPIITRDRFLFPELQILCKRE
ncbi:MAG: Gfo/Idh/MocA family oxidoreductase [Bacteroidales bacterium]|jgi:predicted dehydrogenase|nr:Gfo/Idh/MocA family oxidoreductase [Bacteroidales bacterium]